MAKGSSFEREICKKLSVWWSGDPERDDIFWRSSNSGGRATVRGRKGKRTQGQYGDIAATDPIGQRLLDVVTIELKRGYSGAVIHDLLDRSLTAAGQPFEAFLSQTIAAHEAARSYSWMLITRRDRREAIVWIPRELAHYLELTGSGALGPHIFALVRINGRLRSIRGYLLEHFLASIKPIAFKKLWGRLHERNPKR